MIFAFVRPLEYHLAGTNGKSNICLIKVEGVDQVGIVYKISRFLADQGINIESLKSKLKNIGHELHVDIDIR